MRCPTIWSGKRDSWALLYCRYDSSGSTSSLSIMTSMEERAENYGVHIETYELCCTAAMTSVAAPVSWAKWPAWMRCPKIWSRSRDSWALLYCRYDSSGSTGYLSLMTSMEERAENYGVEVKTHELCCTVAMIAVAALVTRAYDQHRRESRELWSGSRNPWALLYCSYDNSGSTGYLRIWPVSKREPRIMEWK